jgi:hypothetical protein
MRHHSIETNVDSLLQLVLGRYKNRAQIMHRQCAVEPNELFSQDIPNYPRLSVNGHYLLMPADHFVYTYEGMLKRQSIIAAAAELIPEERLKNLIDCLAIGKNKSNSFQAAAAILEQYSSSSQDFAELQAFCQHLNGFISTSNEKTGACSIKFLAYFTYSAQVLCNMFRIAHAAQQRAWSKTDFSGTDITLTEAGPIEREGTLRTYSLHHKGSFVALRDVEIEDIGDLYTLHHAAVLYGYTPGPYPASYPGFPEKLSYSPPTASDSKASAFQHRLDQIDNCAPVEVGPNQITPTRDRAALYLPSPYAETDAQSEWELLRTLMAEREEHSFGVYSLRSNTAQRFAQSYCGGLYEPIREGIHTRFSSASSSKCASNPYESITSAILGGGDSRVACNRATAELIAPHVSATILHELRIQPIVELLAELQDTPRVGSSTSAATLNDMMLRAVNDRRASGWDCTRLPGCFRTLSPHDHATVQKLARHGVPPKLRRAAADLTNYIHCLERTDAVGMTLYTTRLLLGKELPKKATVSSGEHYDHMLWWHTHFGSKTEEDVQKYGFDRSQFFAKYVLPALAAHPPITIVNSAPQLPLVDKKIGDLDSSDPRYADAIRNIAFLLAEQKVASFALKYPDAKKAFGLRTNKYFSYRCPENACVAPQTDYLPHLTAELAKLGEAAPVEFNLGELSEERFIPLLAAIHSLSLRELATLEPLLSDEVVSINSSLSAYFNQRGDYATSFIEVVRTALEEVLTTHAQPQGIGFDEDPFFNALDAAIERRLPPKERREEILKEARFHVERLESLIHAADLITDFGLKPSKESEQRISLTNAIDPLMQGTAETIGWNMTTDPAVSIHTLQSANGSGKSHLLKTVAHAALLKVLTGCEAPGIALPHFDALFVLIDPKSKQEERAILSELAHFPKDKKILVILDEFARLYSEDERMLANCDLLQALHERGNIYVLMATHDHEAIATARDKLKIPIVQHHIPCNEDPTGIAPVLGTVKPGASPSHGVKVARTRRLERD